MRLVRKTLLLLFNQGEEEEQTQGGGYPPDAEYPSVRRRRSRARVRVRGRAVALDRDVVREPVLLTMAFHRSTARPDPAVADDWCRPRTGLAHAPRVSIRTGALAIAVEARAGNRARSSASAPRAGGAAAVAKGQRRRSRAWLAGEEHVAAVFMLGRASGRNATGDR